MSEQEVVLACRALRKHYRQGPEQLTVLDDIDLVVHRGERVAIVGASGSGKSTLLNMLGGLDIASDGVVEVAGVDIKQLGEAARGRLRNRELGFVYQFHHLLGEFTALENVCMPLLMRKMPLAEVRAEGLQLLHKVGLAARTEHKPAELSGGERQRVAIARALVTKPRCVLLDEPTGNLDLHTAESIHDLMTELNQQLGTSFIIVTHDIKLARRMDALYELREGKLMLQLIDSAAAECR